MIESETLRTSLLRTAFGLDWLFNHFSLAGNSERQAVVNLSLSFFPDAMSQEDLRGWERILERSVQALSGFDALIVAAAGNCGYETLNTIGFPANHPSVLGVGAVDFTGRKADFSSATDAKPEIYGYGVDIVSATERDKAGKPLYDRMAGTSMAAPYVAGIACLLRAAKPRATAPEVRDFMIEKASSGVDGIPIARFEQWPVRKVYS